MKINTTSIDRDRLQNLADQLTDLVEELDDIREDLREIHDEMGSSSAQMEEICDNVSGAFEGLNEALDRMAELY